MAKMYGHKWVSTYGEKDDGNIWLATLGELTPDQLMLGLKRCANSGNAWPPSAPEFKSMCKPDFAELGIPSLNEAFNLCCNQYRSPLKKPWPHPAVYWMGKNAGWFMLGTEKAEKSLKVFKGVYEDIVNRLANGEQFTLPSQKSNSNLLDHDDNSKKTRTEENKQAASKALSEMKEMFR